MPLEKVGGASKALALLPPSVLSRDQLAETSAARRRAVERRPMARKTLIIPACLLDLLLWVGGGQTGIAFQNRRDGLIMGEATMLFHASGSERGAPLADLGAHRFLNRWCAGSVLAALGGNKLAVPRVAVDLG
jgi:hypothetical protein